MADALDGKFKFLTFSNAVWFAFLLYVFSLALMQPFFYYKNLRFSLSEFIFPILFALFTIAVLTKKIVFRFHKIYFFLSVYFAAMLVSSVFSINPQQSFIKLAGQFYLLSLVVIAVNLVTNFEKLKTLLKIWLAGTVLTIAVGFVTIFLFYFQRDNWLLEFTTSVYGAVPVGNYPRLTSTFISASMFCNYLSASLFLIVAAAKLDVFRRPVYFLLLFLTSVCAFFTISSGIGGFVLSIFVIGWLLKDENAPRAKLSLGFGIVFALFFFALNFIALQPHPTAPFTFNLFGYELYPSSRLMVWMDSARTFYANFWNGVGLGQNACNVYYQNTEGTPAFLTDAHNAFLSVAAQNGIFGLAAFLLLFSFILKESFAAINGKKAASMIFYLLTAAFICAFCYQGLTGSFEDARHLWLLVGLWCAAKSLAANN